MSDHPRSRTVGDLLDEMAARYPDNEAVVSQGRRVSYRELNDASARLARGFLALGLGKGDHVAILMGNRVEWLLTWFALNKIGAVAVGVSTWSTPRELAYILKHADVKVLVMAEGMLGKDYVAMVTTVYPELAASEAGQLRTPAAPFLRTVVVDGPGRPGMLTLAGLLERGESISPEILRAAQGEVRAHEVALVCYTSGSTGTPKGVQLVHGTMIEHGFNIGEAEQFDASDRFWLVLPLFWSAGNANTTMVVMTHGGAAVLQEHFEPAEALDLFEKERCTHYFAFPNVTAALYNHPSRAGRSFPSLRVAISTGNPEGIRMLRELGFQKFLHPYGTTEDYGFATINHPDDPLEVVYRTQGRPLPNLDLRIVNPETGRQVLADQSGEICLRGHVTVGYYKDAEKNEEAFDAEGYFHTGDLGYLGRDGRLHLEGRLKELVKTGGSNVSPMEVEAVLLSHPDVVEAYVVGLPDDLLGQVVAAFVKTRSSRATEEELRALCRGELSAYKVPQIIRFRDSFPMTDTGKVAKRRLVEEESASQR